MANLNEVSSFEPVYRLEKTDKVLGGPGGVANVPLQNLANRTKYLFDAIAALESGGGPFPFNASAGVLPTGGTDGPGVGGIKRKDTYYVTVAGTVAGVTLQIGDTLTAKNDDADDINEFVILQANSSLATPTILGMVKLVQNLSGGSAADAVLSVAGLITLFAQINNPTFTGDPKAPTPASGNNSQSIANTAWVFARLNEVATALNNALSAETNARTNADTAEANARSSADNSLNNAKADKSINIGTNGGLQGGGNLSADRTLSIAAGGVDTSKLADGSVTTNKIGAGQVNVSKLATDVNDKWRGNGARTDLIVDFTGIQGLTGKTYGRYLYYMPRNLAFLRPFVYIQFQARRDSGGVDRIQCLLQRNPNPDSGGTWSTIQNIIYRLDGDSWTTCVMSTIDTSATVGDNYYRVVCTNVEGVANVWSDDSLVNIFSIPCY